MVRDGNLQALASHPSWPDLEATVNAKQLVIERTVLAHVMNPAQAVNQRQVDFLRGFVDGMQWLVAQPHTSERRLARYMKERGVTVEGES